MNEAKEIAELQIELGDKESVFQCLAEDYLKKEDAIKRFFKIFDWQTNAKTDQDKRSYQPALNHYRKILQNETN